VLLCNERGWTDCDAVQLRRPWQLGGHLDGRLNQFLQCKALLSGIYFWALVGCNGPRLVGEVPSYTFHSRHLSRPRLQPIHSSTPSRGPLPLCTPGDHVPKINMKVTAYAAALLGLVSVALGQAEPSPTESVGCEPHGDHWYVAASTWLSFSMLIHVSGTAKALARLPARLTQGPLPPSRSAASFTAITGRFLHPRGFLASVLIMSQGLRWSSRDPGSG
jgi:hypothetical protein